MPRMHGSKPYRVIMGKLRGKSDPADPMLEQSYRYPIDAWTEHEAMAHCHEHGRHRFEPAGRGD